jgi:hypothetical protein
MLWVLSFMRGASNVSLVVPVGLEKHQSTVMKNFPSPRKMKIFLASGKVNSPLGNPPTMIEALNLIPARLFLCGEMIGCFLMLRKSDGQAFTY